MRIRPPADSHTGSTGQPLFTVDSVDPVCDPVSPAASPVPVLRIDGPRQQNSGWRRSAGSSSEAQTGSRCGGWPGRSQFCT